MQFIIFTESYVVVTTIQSILKIAQHRREMVHTIMSTISN